MLNEKVLYEPNNAFTCMIDIEKDDLPTIDQVVRLLPQRCVFTGSVIIDEIEVTGHWSFLRHKSSEGLLGVVLTEQPIHRRGNLARGQT